MTATHPEIAIMYAYVVSLFDGSASPFWPHFVLLGGSILASIIVGAGIIFEGAEYSPETHRIAAKLVIVGIAFEALFTICLFGFDEGISSAQQSKIIELNEYIAGRRLTKPQYEAIQSLKGKLPAILILPEDHCAECFNFASQIGAAFTNADIKAHLEFAKTLHGSGPSCVYQWAPFASLVRMTLSLGGIPAHLCPIPPPGFDPNTIPKDAAVISVVEAPGFPSAEKPYLGEPK